MIARLKTELEKKKKRRHSDVSNQRKRKIARKKEVLSLIYSVHICPSWQAPDWALRLNGRWPLSLEFVV